MNIASRTPEGEGNHCGVCGNELILDPSRPPGDAPCPCCGTLVWFKDPIADQPVVRLSHRDRRRRHRRKTMRGNTA
jgi:hypothetical protein